MLVSSSSAFVSKRLCVNNGVLIICHTLKKHGENLRLTDVFQATNFGSCFHPYGYSNLGMARVLPFMISPVWLQEGTDLSFRFWPRWCLVDVCHMWITSSGCRFGGLHTGPGFTPDCRDKRKETIFVCRSLNLAASVGCTASTGYSVRALKILRVLTN